MTPVRFKGQDIDLGGIVRTVPPLALGDVKELLPRIQKMKLDGGIPGDESIDTVIDVAHAALKRNYPDITKDDLYEVIDLGNVRELFRVIMGLNGLTKIEDGSGNSGAEATSP